KRGNGRGGKRSRNGRGVGKNQRAGRLCTLSARIVATAPNSRIDDRITRFICTTDSDGQSRRLRQFQLSIDPAERIDELKLDVTAPTIAARPSSPMAGGTARASSSGIASAGVARSPAAASAGPG